MSQSILLSLDLQNRSAFRGEIEIHLEPRVFDLLVVLAQNQGQLVSKDKLVTYVWGGRAISDSAISTCVKTARSVLDDDGQRHRAIKTVYGKGFLLLDGILELVEKTALTSTDRIATNHYRKPKVAVLPFHFEQGNAAGEFCALSMHEEMTTTLSRTKALFVISKNSSQLLSSRNMDPSECALQLGAKFGIYGQISSRDGKFRANIHLVDAEDNTIIWSESFTNRISNIFDVQHEIAISVCNSVIPKIRNLEIEAVARKPPANLNAYELVLRAFPLVWHLKEGDNNTAITILENALGLDPDYPLANALFAWCLTQKFMYFWHGSRSREELKTRSLEMALAFIEREPEDPLLLTVYSNIMSNIGQSREAKRAVDAAVGLDPSLSWAWNRSAWLAGYDCEVGKSLERFKLSLDLSPFDTMNFNAYFGMAQAHFINEDYREASRFLDRTLGLRPDAIFVHRLRTATKFFQNEPHEARASLMVLKKHSPGLTVDLIRKTVPIKDKAVLERLCFGLASAGLQT
jgi:adenylate cyclase